MRAHTPGPWAADVDAGFVTGPDTSEPVICDLVPRDAESFTDEDDANGLLIAAAPDLLAVLKRVMAYEAEREEDPAVLWRDVGDAIAKAEGRAS